MQTTINIYMQSNTKFRPIIESLGFKKKRPLPSQIRMEWLDDLQQYEKYIQVDEDNPTKLKRIYGDLMSDLVNYFYLSNLPLVGRRCVGLFRIDEFDNEFDTYLHI